MTRRHTEAGGSERAEKKLAAAITEDEDTGDGDAPNKEDLQRATRGDCEEQPGHHLRAVRLATGVTPMSDKRIRSVLTQLTTRTMSGASG